MNPIYSHRTTHFFISLIGVLLLTISTAQSDENLPGTTPYSKALRDSLKAALIAKGTNYQPRTEHLLASGQPKFINRLILEDSPYLLQHAHNPVNWFAWGNEAFEKARQEDKPIFLSIGYSTCHWCHVMEEESFDNTDIARLMNEHFICIKVDREQRPDVDEVYMTAVVMTRGQGGWPMSSFLTADGKPFFGGTYFPPETFTQILKNVAQVWEEKRPQLIAQANQIAERVKQVTAASGEARQLGKTAIQEAISNILGMHDSSLGGFGNAPKFPQEAWLLLLLKVVHHDEALAAALNSLKKMAEGGLYDQIGGGFHRYSTDAHWLTPHFEKMLYNQAHIARAYLMAYQLTGDIIYATVARQTLDYVLREMTAPQGGFYSATDADSEGEEGLFFVWSPAQIRAALNETEAEFALNLYGVTAQGNFEGKNILHLPISLEKYANEKALPLPQLIEKLDVIREKLRCVREEREPPLRDDKIITAWNGMMITTLALAADILEERRYLEAAQRAATFIGSKLTKGQGELWRVYVHKKASISAHQEDYAYFAEALLTLYDVSNDKGWLNKAQEVADTMLHHFWDKAQGGFFMSRESDTPLIARPKSPNDGAIPSGNSVAVRVLAMIAARTGIERYRDKANATLNAFSLAITQQPSSYAYMLLAADELLHGEMGLQQYGARGAVKATAKLTHHGQTVTIEVEIQDGWHINAHKPLQENLIPTVVRLDKTQWRLEQVSYPKPEPLRLSFQQATLALYQGTIHLRGQLIPPPNLPLQKKGESSLSDKINLVPIRLTFQACNDKMCLPPEELVFRMGVK